MPGDEKVPVTPDYSRGWGVTFRSLNNFSIKFENDFCFGFFERSEPNSRMRSDVEPGVIQWQSTPVVVNNFGLHRLPTRNRVREYLFVGVFKNTAGCNSASEPCYLDVKVP